MTPAVRLCEELTASGVRLSAADGRLLFAGPKRERTEERMASMAKYKADILQLLSGGGNPVKDEPKSLHDIAHKSGWLVLSSGEAYSQQVSKTMTVFLLREHDRSWTIWRGSWHAGVPEPSSSKTLGCGLSLEDAVLRGNGYVDWIQRRNKSSRSDVY